MSVVHFHNLSIPYVGQPKEFFYFDKNASYFARSGDVIIVRDTLPDVALSDYYEENSITGSGLRYLVVPSEPDAFSIFSNQDFLEKFHEIVNALRASELEVFAWTANECALAAGSGLPHPRHPPHYEHYVSKSRFRRHARTLGINIPPGYEFLNTRLELLWSIFKLHLKGQSSIVIKQDDGVAGNGFSRSEARNVLSVARAVLGNPYFPHTHIIPLASRARLVEAWVPDVACRPSVQFHIDAKGVVSVLSVHDQLMRDDGVTYQGCRSSHWLHPSIVQRVTVDVEKYATQVAREGYRGHGSLGAVVDKNDKIFYTEGNPRRVISSYPYQIVAKNLFPKGPTPPYIALEIKHAKWQGMNSAELLKDLAPVLFTKERGSGVIPIDTKLLGYNGTVFMLSIGQSKEEADSFITLCQTGQI